MKDIVPPLCRFLCDTLFECRRQSSAPSWPASGRVLPAASYRAFLRLQLSIWISWTNQECQRVLCSAALSSSLSVYISVAGLGLQGVQVTGSDLPRQVKSHTLFFHGAFTSRSGSMQILLRLLQMLGGEIVVMKGLREVLIGKGEALITRKILRGNDVVCVQDKRTM